ncbi:hydroxylase [Acidobacteria bacterium Mor1]|nr:hydroxylase [Acidobacteria bacterium Mor1]
MKIQYLEIVSPDAEAVCASYEQMLGLQFSEPIAAFGNARVADLPTGGKFGVRAPLRDDEGPVVRPYFLVEDIEASVAQAAEAGAQIAMPPMDMPGQGKFAVFIHGGIEQGFWQL